MVADPMLEDMIRNQVDTNVVQKLNKLPPKDIPIGLLHGLQALVDDNRLSEANMMTKLFQDFFPKWLSEIKESIIFKTQ